MLVRSGFLLPLTARMSCVQSHWLVGLSVPAGVPSRFFASPPQSKDMHGWQIGDSKLALGRMLI